MQLTNKPRGSRFSSWISKTLPFWLVFPTVVILLSIQVYPTLYSFYISVNKLKAGDLQFVGLQNYRLMFDSSDFLQSLGRTGIYAGSYLILTISLGMLIALLLNRRVYFTPLYVTILFIPWVLSDVVSGTMWRWMFQQSYGMIQVALNPLINNTSLLSNDIGSMAIVIGATVWKSLAFTALLFLGALQTVSAEVLESASLDGANRWSTFWKIIIPIIKPTILVTILLTSIRGINSLGMILAITNGGPGEATTTAAVQLYRMAWQYGDFGGAAALAVFLFFINILLTIVYFRFIQVEH
jgi:ABC-type sugar transport system permease subunit